MVGCDRLDSIALPLRPIYASDIMKTSLISRCEHVSKHVSRH
jgi:hypothetical protein